MSSDAPLKDNTPSEGTGAKLTKECSKCREVKPLDMFYLDKTSADGRRGDCKVCKRKVGKGAHEEARRRYTAYIKHRGNRCELCHRRYPIEVYHFHHLDPTKKMQSLAVRSWKGTNMYRKTLEECEKCALLCSNCHIVVHTELRKGNDLLGDLHGKTESSD